jgi:hypothetical protein
MPDNKTPKGYFPLNDDDIIISEHAKRLLEQERQFIETERPMEKLEALFIKDAPITHFTYRVNGAGQFSIFRADDPLEKGVCIILSARILSPCMGDDKNSKPEISMRYSVQLGDLRFYFARLAAVKTPNGTTSCAVCAIPNNSADKYYFEDNHGQVFTGGELDIPITTDDLIVATRLNKADLMAAVRLSYKLIRVDIDTTDTLKHLLKAIEKFEF